MASITIGDLSPDALRALRTRAVENNRSPEREALTLLEEFLCPDGRLHVGSTLAVLSKASGLSNEDVEALEAVRNSNPSPPMWFG